MAMTRCKECGNEVSTKAEACPKCGAKRPRPTSIGTWIIGGFLALAGFSCIIGSQRTDDARAQATAAENVRLNAMSPEQRAAAEKQKALDDARKRIEAGKLTSAYACREIVTKHLKDPDSAKWESPWYSDAQILENGARYKIQISGRSKNSFGAYTLSVFDCDLRRSGDNWVAIQIKENGK